MANNRTEQVYFGAGCFWHAEHVYAAQEGVLDTEVGYASFRKERTGNKGRVEVVKIEYNPEETSFAELIDTFWTTHNPSNSRNQDDTYIEKSVLFYVNDQQKKTAQEALFSKQNQDQTVLTEVLEMHKYQKAQEKDQQYYMKEKKRRVFP